MEYDGVVVGQFYADMLVNERILIELKAVKELDDIHLAQALNYLRNCLKSTLHGSASHQLRQENRAGCDFLPFYGQKLIVLVRRTALKSLIKQFLRATDFETCLLINFGKTRIDVRRLHRSPRWKKTGDE